VLVMTHGSMRITASVFNVFKREVCSCSARAWPPHKLMPMPRLSPSMQCGVLERWVVRSGDPIEMYDVVCHVSTDQLTTENPTGHPHVLEIEVHEDGFLAKILVAPGSRVAPDEPIAVFCEERNDIPAFSDFSLAPGDLVSRTTF